MGRQSLSWNGVHPMYKGAYGKHQREENNTTPPKKEQN